MQNSRSVGLWCVVLSLSLLSLGTTVRAEDELPPLEGEATSGADLPPLPESGDEPVSSANSEIPSLEELPPLADENTAGAAEMPSEGGMVDIPPPVVSAGPPARFSSKQEITDLSMDDRLKQKELVLWLSGGPSYGSITTKGAYSVGEKAVGGMGYNVGIGGMISSGIQVQFDLFGTPRTKRSTVDHAMLGLGFRLGFISVMGLFGVQQGPDLTVLNFPPLTQLFSIGAKAGMDIILSHPENSRVSIGLAPEAFYVTPQGKDGYTNAGVSVSLRIYGYESPF